MFSGVCLSVWWPKDLSLSIVRMAIDPLRFIIPRQYCWQVRIHRDYFTVKDVMTEYLEQSDIAFIFQHDADDEVSRTHCHVYCFNLRRQRSTIDGYLRKRFNKGNGDFSVSQTCGKKKRPLDVIGAWIYGTKEEAIEPSYTKGLNESEIAFLKQEAVEFYQKLNEARKSRDKALEIVEVIIEKEKRDNIWTDYYETVFLEWKKGTLSRFYHWTLDRFKRWIVADYLNKGKAPPRVADRNRYAYGLYLLNTHGFRKDIDPDTDLRQLEY